jgi:hypothetical protein
MPLIEPATEAMLTMLPPPFASILGSAHFMVMYMARTLSLKLKSQSLGEQSRMVPLCTYPAQLNRIDSGGNSSMILAIAPSSSTSSTRVWMPVAPA